MIKYHKLIAFCFGLLFLVVLQKFATPEPTFRFLLPAFFFYVLLVTLYNRWYLAQVQKYNFWTLLRPLFLLLSAFGVFLIIPTESLRGLFLILSVGIISLFEIVLGDSAENILLNETLIIAFGLFFSAAGFYQYAPSYGPWYLVAVFLGSSLLTRSFLEFVPQDPQAKLAGSLVLGLFSSEIFWCLNFLPLHFSALGLILFNIFYLCLILNYYHLFHILSFKKIQFHLLLIAASTLVVLLTTPQSIIQ